MRNSLIDIVKALGILSVVMGHCCSGVVIPVVNIPLNQFLYSYHLMVFFFASGFLFKEKDARMPAEFIGKRLVQLVSMLLLYNTIFVFLHNMFSYIGITNNRTRYGVTEIFQNIMRSFLFEYADELLGAFWFLPMFFLGICLFCMTFRQALKMKNPVMGHIALMGGFAVVAIMANRYGITWKYGLQNSLLAVPVLYAGYFCGRYWEKAEKRITWYGTILSAAAILFVLSLKIGRIELSVNDILHPLLFYPVTFLGIYFCLGVGKLLDRNRALRAVFSEMGKNSFHIMALHFLGFKFVDLLYARMHGISDADRVGRFPHSDFGLDLSYVIVGVCLPLVLLWISRKCREYLYGNLKEKR